MVGVLVVQVLRAYGAWPRVVGLDVAWRGVAGRGGARRGSLQGACGQLWSVR